MPCLVFSADSLIINAPFVRFRNGVPLSTGVLGKIEANSRLSGAHRRGARRTLLSDDGIDQGHLIAFFRSRIRVSSLTVHSTHVFGVFPAAFDLVASEFNIISLAG